MKILVLGAGVVGTTSAWYLARSGHQVSVIERQPGAGLETSFANGGQISVSHAEPWSNLRILPKALRWLGQEDAPLLFRMRADPALIRWVWRFLAECRPSRTRANIRSIVQLALYSRAQLQALRGELGLEYDQLSRGILHIYSDPREFAGAVEAAAVMRDLGLDRDTVSVDRCVEIEPALAGCRQQLVGGDYTASDESGDAHKFTQSLAAKAREAGVRFLFDTEIMAIRFQRERVNGVDIRAGEGEDHLSADAYVLALGSESPLLLKPLGLYPAIYPAKGYSATVDLQDNSIAPQVSLTDDEKKLVFSRLGQRLRIAGTAEFNGYNLELNPVRCAALMQRAKALFPDLRPASEPRYWCGLRPATPSNFPYLGQSPYANLWLNTGHGTLGWTMACGSAAALADLIDGRAPQVALPAFRL